jgi:2-furoyl-CoA dehydrogenase large subunit
MLHVESPSPFTPLGSKGVGEGNCMSTPVCIANAVADALGAADIDLPLKPDRLLALLHGPERERPRQPNTPAPVIAAVSAGRGLHGSGSAEVGAPPEAVWAMLLDADALASIIPGAHSVEKLSPTHFRAEVTLGVGPVKGRYRAEIELFDLAPPSRVKLRGAAVGALGAADGEGQVTLAQTSAGTRLSYTYEAKIGGKAASVGGRLLDAAARIVIRQFFEALARRVAPSSRMSVWTRISRLVWRRG